MTAATRNHDKQKGVASLRAYLSEIAQSDDWPLLAPLPVTRELGAAYGVSNVSAFRVLAELRNLGLVWQAANGRYYRAAARRLVEKPPPVACLLRKLQAWTEVGREMLQGVDEACGAMDRAILLVHDRVLFEQTGPTGPTTTGSREKLLECLEDFLILHGDRTSGVLLDELWPDDVLAAFEGRLHRAVILYRRSKLPFIGSVAADASSAAAFVIGLADRRGDREIIVISPRSDYLPSKEMENAVAKAAKQSGIPLTTLAFSEAECRDFFAGAVRTKRRALLVATEDNTAAASLSMLKKEGWDGPQHLGLVSTMGSRIALDEGITSAGFDFREIGRRAVAMATQPTEAALRWKIPATLRVGSTT